MKNNLKYIILILFLSAKIGTSQTIQVNNIGSELSPFGILKALRHPSYSSNYGTNISLGLWTVNGPTNALLVWKNLYNKLKPIDSSNFLTQSAFKQSIKRAFKDKNKNLYLRIFNHSGNQFFTKNATELATLITAYLKENLLDGVHLKKDRNLNTTSIQYWMYCFLGNLMKDNPQIKFIYDDKDTTISRAILYRDYASAVVQYYCSI